MPPTWSMCRCVKTMPCTRCRASPNRDAADPSGCIGAAPPSHSSGRPKSIAPCRVMPVSISRMRPSAHSSTNDGWLITYGSFGFGSFDGSSTAERGIGWLAVLIIDSRTGRSVNIAASQASPPCDRAVAHAPGRLPQCAHSNPVATKTITAAMSAPIPIRIFRIMAFGPRIGRYLVHFRAAFKPPLRPA